PSSACAVSAAESTVLRARAATCWRVCVSAGRCHDVPVAVVAEPAHAPRKLDSPHDDRVYANGPPDVERYADVQRSYLMPPARGQIQGVARLEDHFERLDGAAERELLVVRLLRIKTAGVRQSGAEGVRIEPWRR